MSNKSGDPLLDTGKDVLGGVGELAVDWQTDPWDVETIVTEDDVDVVGANVPKKRSGN